MAAALLGIIWVASGAVITACADDATTNANPKSITPGELAELIQTDEAPLILDVRSSKEYSEGHIPGAVNIPYDQLADHLSDLHAAKTDEIVDYVRAWWAAAAAAPNAARGEAIYARAPGALYVNLFLASQLRWPEQGLKLRQLTRFPEQNDTRLEYALVLLHAQVHVVGRQFDELEKACSAQSDDDEARDESQRKADERRRA